MWHSPIKDFLSIYPAIHLFITHPSMHVFISPSSHFNAHFFLHSGSLGSAGSYKKPIYHGHGSYVSWVWESRQEEQAFNSEAQVIHIERKRECCHATQSCKMWVLCPLIGVSLGMAVVTQSPDVSAVEEETVNITCCWPGQIERFKVTWFKNQTQVKTETSVKKKQDNQKSKPTCSELTFEPIRRGDSGRYTCKLTMDIPKYAVYVGTGTLVTVITGQKKGKRLERTDVITVAAGGWHVADCTTSFITSDCKNHSFGCCAFQTLMKMNFSTTSWDACLSSLFS